MPGSEQRRRGRVRGTVPTPWIMQARTLHDNRVRIEE